MGSNLTTLTLINLCSVEVFIFSLFWRDVCRLPASRDFTLSIDTQCSVFNKSFRPRLHGSGQIFALLDRLFTWICANSVTDCSAVYIVPCKFWDQSFWLFCFTFVKQPAGLNRAICTKSCMVRVFTRVITTLEPCRSKSWPAFSGPKLVY